MLFTTLSHMYPGEDGLYIYLINNMIFSSSGCTAVT